MKILNLLSLTQAALVFDNFDQLNNLGVNFDSDYSLLDRLVQLKSKSDFKTILWKNEIIFEDICFEDN